MKKINELIMANVAMLEMTGVMMRIFSFSLVSWLGPESPFMFVWIFNTIDAILLSWCAMLKKDRAYTLLNTFWILVGIVGILRAGGLLH
jgi:phosphoglycerol transferase MdoB-like AlkP superfamily enzyme